MSSSTILTTPTSRPTPIDAFSNGTQPTPELGPQHQPLDWSGRLLHASFFLFALICSALFVCLLCCLTKGESDHEETPAPSRAAKVQAELVQAQMVAGSDDIEASARLRLPLINEQESQTMVSQKTLVDRICLGCVGCSGEKYYFTHLQASIDVRQFQRPPGASRADRAPRRPASRTTRSPKEHATGGKRANKQMVPAFR